MTLFQDAYWLCTVEAAERIRENWLMMTADEARSHEDNSPVRALHHSRPKLPTVPMIAAWAQGFLG